MNSARHSNHLHLGGSLSCLLGSAVLVVVLALSGCGGDGGAGAGLGPSRDSGRVENDGGDGEGDRGGTGETGADTVGDVSQVDLPECLTGTRECGGDGARRVCTGAGEWGTEPCAAGLVCTGDGECTPDDAGPCVDGARECVAGVPSVCTAGLWIPGRECAAAEQCWNGECGSRACAAAGTSESYLGCDYYAVPLPSSAWEAGGGTPDSPLGIVLANASASEAVSVSVYEADGVTLAQIIGEVTVEPPSLPLFGDIDPVTIRSEIHDSAGSVVNAGFTEARGVSIPPGGMGVFLVGHRGNPAASLVDRNSYRVRTNAPVAAYQFGPYCCNFSFSNDASLLFPVSTLGTEYLFLGVPSWDMAADPEFGPIGDGIPNTLTVVGTTIATLVTIELPEDAEVVPGTGVSISGQTVTATLGAGEVLTLLGAPAVQRTDRLPLGHNLSGARISSTHPVVVFSGHQCTNYPQDQQACDHLEEQLFPIETWGDAYTLAPPNLRTTSPSFSTETSFWKIIAADDGTRITLGASFSSLEASPPGFAGVPDCSDNLEGDTTIFLDAGEHCEFGTRRALSLDSTNPILVMGVISGSASAGFGATNAGDPSIFLVPPRRQYRLDYAFLTPTTYAADHLTVSAPAGTRLLLDGEVVDLSRAASVAGSSDVYVDVLLSDGPHRITGDRQFGILVYAYDDWVSYAFTGGLNLVKE